MFLLRRNSIAKSFIHNELDSDLQSHNYGEHKDLSFPFLTTAAPSADQGTFGNSIESWLFRERGTCAKHFCKQKVLRPSFIMGSKAVCVASLPESNFQAHLILAPKETALNVYYTSMWLILSKLILNKNRVRKRLFIMYVAHLLVLMIYSYHQIQVGLHHPQIFFNCRSPNPWCSTPCTLWTKP